MSKHSADEIHPPEIQSKKRKMTHVSEADAVPALVPEYECVDQPENLAVTQAKVATPKFDDEEMILDDDTQVEDASKNATIDKKSAKTPKKATKPKTTKTPRTKTDKASNPDRPTKTPKKPPVSDGFFNYPYDTAVPEANEFWGIKPLPGSQRPDPDQPSARESNGQTNPPMWEDRGYRYKRGTRHVKYFGPITPDNVDTLKPTLDQEELLVVKMIDMRAKSGKDQMPKRAPAIYCYGKVPRDWNHMQTIKALNDRRYQAIDRMTMDAPWTRIERAYLASLLAENPNASIWELTELHNDRFMNKDFTTETGFDFAELSTGRTVESVRHEYCTYKPIYDKGEVPDRIRWRGDPSAAAKAMKKSGRFEKFGPPSKALQMAHDAAQAGEDDSDSDEEFSKTVSFFKVHPFVGQEKLSDEEETLLELAGAYVEEVDPSPKKVQPEVSIISPLPVVQPSVLTPPQTPKTALTHSKELKVIEKTTATRQLIIDEDYDDEEEL
ncbi:hypothetical protein GMOD_00003509 [Pyrenophora seminiperda CCB06]|uniref:Uncharacterized protein n=1 Tax=Pyrenophora seminiperda CCB06 TaxID=1302712 RepID=A0A3M7MIV0_9PLEO|nr:hypothetical protein GMOD_00003509 [Pyrenophora seminiperda CCB06]